MDKLPPEIHRVILSQLDLNDLARCGRVSRNVGDRANEVLSTITCIYHKNDCSDDVVTQLQHLCFAIRKSAPNNTSCQALFTQENLPSFLKFVTKKCPRLSTLIATDFSVRIEDLSTLTQHISSFLLGKVIPKRLCSREDNTISGYELAANFPELKFYHLSDSSRPCHNEVTRAYAELRSTQLLEYRDYCLRLPHICQTTVDVRSLHELFLICAESPLVFGELRQSSLNSLKFIDLEKPPLDKGDLPHLPNLLRATLVCEESLNKMVRWLLNSPKLSAVFLSGEINEESIPALNLLLSNCAALKIFEFTGYTLDPNFVEDPEQFLDLNRSKCLKEVAIKERLGDPRGFMIQVIFPSECDSIECHSYTLHFNMGTREYIFYDCAPSFDRMRAFANPVELEVSDLNFLTDGLLSVCPLISRLKYHCHQHDSSQALPMMLQFVLAQNDVSEILIFSTRRLSHSLPRALFEGIKERRERSFSVTIRGISPEDKAIWIHAADVSLDWSISFDDYEGLLQVHVKIPAAVNVPPNMDK